MSAAALAAGSMAGCAVALLVAGPAAVETARPLRWQWGLPLLAVAGAVALPPRWWPVGLIVAGAVLGGMRLWRARRARLAAVAVAGRVVESCEQLAAELATGQPPGAALDRCAAAWPAIEPVAAALRMGADVPTAWRSVAAGAEGAADLALVAAAWQVSTRTGQGLAGAVDRIALDLRASAATRQVVAGELASARATARMVGLLPIAALAMGSGVGGHPWAFLLGTPIGLSALALGLLVGWLGLAWIERIAAEVGV